MTCSKLRGQELTFPATDGNKDPGLTVVLRTKDAVQKCLSDSKQDASFRIYH